MMVKTNAISAIVFPCGHVAGSALKAGNLLDAGNQEINATMQRPIMGRIS